jgi:3-hydroxyacyl-[acyl-carrier-protein] dehydratase
MGETLDIDRILQVLPHRWPFVLVDRVTEVIPGEHIRGAKCVTFSEPWFQGHFPGRRIMPGVLIVEALAQLGGVLAHATEPLDEATSLVALLGIERAKFRHTVTPGDKLDLEVNVRHRRARVWKLEGAARVDGMLCASAQLLVGVVPRTE